MICKPCKDAADIRDRADNPNSPEVMEAIRTFHQDCLGATHCDCQCRIELKHDAKRS